MPIYEYECKACGQHSEIIQKIAEPHKTDCPHCHKAALQRLISPVGFQLKGTGWYATDFKKSGQDKPQSKPESKSENKAENPTEPKPKTPDKKEST